MPDEHHPTGLAGSPVVASERLSVLLLNSLYSPFIVGGAEIVTETLATALAALGHRVSVVTSCSPNQAPSVERMDGVDVYRFFPRNVWWLFERFAQGDSRSVFDKLRWRLTDAWNRHAEKSFDRILETIRPDVVHTHNIKGFSPAIWHAAKRRGIPVIHTGHSYDLICATGALLGRTGVCSVRSRCVGCAIHGIWYRAQASAIDVFCSPSDFLLRTHAAAGFVPRRSARVQNGIARHPLPLSGGEPDDSRPVRYLYIGQLSAHKGIDTIIAAVRLAAASAFTIDIAGRGEEAARVETLAASDVRVRYHGFVEGDRKARLLAGADALIFPSIWVENSPISIAEAFQFGLPVIASQIGAIPEFVKHRDNGLLFEAGNAMALAACMVELSEKPDELRRLAEGAERWGSTWPTPAMMAAEYVGIYRSSLQEEPGSKRSVPGHPAGEPARLLSPGAWP